MEFSVAWSESQLKRQEKVFCNELMKQLKKRKCYEIIEIRINKCMTLRLLKIIEFAEI